VNGGKELKIDEQIKTFSTEAVHIDYTWNIWKANLNQKGCDVHQCSSIKQNLEQQGYG
jgi:hypothetical protein